MVADALDLQYSLRVNILVAHMLQRQLLKLASSKSLTLVWGRPRNCLLGGLRSAEKIVFGAIQRLKKIYHFNTKLLDKSSICATCMFQ